MRKTPLAFWFLPLLSVLAALPRTASSSGGLLAPFGAPGLREEITSVCHEASVVIIGERHRQPLSHAFFLEVVDAFVARGERVVVGLEIASNRQADLDAEIGGLRPAGGAVHPIVDGASYRELIAALGRRVRSPNASVEVRAIDAPQGSGAHRDREMASRVREALQGDTCDRVLVLAGNLHALKQVPWSAETGLPRPKLAGLLAEEGVAVVSLVQRFPGPCDGGATASLHASDAEATTSAVLDLWGLLNADPSRAEAAPHLATDGVVSWVCAD